MNEKEQKTDQMMEVSRLNVLAGLWLILAPYAIPFTDPSAVWNSIILGVLIGGVALTHWVWATRQTWLDWLDGLLGVWLIASPFALILSGPAGVNNIVTGVIVILFSILGVFTESKIGFPRPLRV